MLFLRKTTEHNSEICKFSILHEPFPTGQKLYVCLESFISLITDGFQKLDDFQ